MKTAFFGGVFIVAFLLSACKQRGFNSSETKNITGPGLGEQRWLSSENALSQTDINTFENLNPGYTLGAEQLVVTATDEENRTVFKPIKTRVLIRTCPNQECYGRQNSKTVATTEYAREVLYDVGCDRVYEEGYRTGTGMVVGGRLVGFEGQGLCVDKQIGKEFCTKSGKKYTMVGCTVPNLRAGTPTGVIVFK